MGNSAPSPDPSGLTISSSSVTTPKSREETDTQPSPRKSSAKLSTPPPVHRKSSVSDLISRLTASTAASRSKRRDKNESPSPGQRGSSGSSSLDSGSGSGYRSVSSPTPVLTNSSPSLLHKLTFGQGSGSPPKRPVISRPMPAPPESRHILRSRKSNRTIGPGGSTIRSVSPAVSERSTRTIGSLQLPSTPVLHASPHNGMAATPPSDSPDPLRMVPGSSFGTNPRSAPAAPSQRSRQVSGRGSALGKPSPLGRQRTASAEASTSSRVAELKAKIVDLERTIHEGQAALADERVVQLQAQLDAERSRRKELEQSLSSQPHSGEQAADKLSPVAVESELKRVKEELAAAEASKSRVIELLKLSKTQLEQECEAADTAKVARDNLEWQVKGLQVSHRTLEQQLVISQRDARRCRRTLSALETKVRELQVQLEEKNLENDELSQTIERIMRAAQHYWRHGHTSASENDSSRGDSTDTTPETIHSKQFPSASSMSTSSTEKDLATKT